MVTHVRLAMALGAICNEHSVIAVDQPQAPKRGRGWTGVATSKRAAAKRRNMRARSAK